MLFYLYLVVISILQVIILLPLWLVLMITGQTGRLGWGIPKMNSIWFHAASMGEVNALKPLLEDFTRQHGAERIILTTMTATGLATARKIDLPIQTAYIPLDLPILISIFIRRLSPSLIVIMETEFWPQMLYQAKLKHIPVVLVNARLTDTSFKDYQNTRAFWKKPWQAFTAINAQSELDKDRFIELGFENVRSCGNLKFALSLPEYENIEKYIRFGVSADDFVLVVGSSRPGEEQMFLEIYPQLKQTITNFKLIIAPRHLRRINEVLAVFSQENAVLFSKLKSQSGYDILIVDQIGLLTEIYSLADLVIVGGSFRDFGGHNPLEPAYYGKPIIMGEFHSSCQDSVNRLLQKEAIVISQPEELLDNIIKLFKNLPEREKLGANARMVLENNRHSLTENLKTIQQYIN
ncbi:MAG: 3-deoxy-D-manno-octulosonic acid transferase [Candidatus Cloacimonetes bacterium]|nr:3-deoxy-D-manno-octulosonic acid transferase [Candidatus Cloacimonadota bacterium]